MTLRKSDYLHLAIGALAYLFILPLGPIVAGAITGTTIGVARELRELRDGHPVQDALAMIRDIVPFTLGGALTGVALVGLLHVFGVDLHLIHHAH